MSVSSELFSFSIAYLHHCLCHLQSRLKNALKRRVKGVLHFVKEGYVEEERREAHDILYGSGSGSSTSSESEGNDDEQDLSEDGGLYGEEDVEYSDDDADLEEFFRDAKREQGEATEASVIQLRWNTEADTSKLPGRSAYSGNSDRTSRRIKQNERLNRVSAQKTPLSKAPFHLVFEFNSMHLSIHCAIL